MFIWFASQLPNKAADLFALHPSDLIALLEFAWDHRANDLAFPTGDPRHRSDLGGMTGSWMGQFLATPPPAAIASIVNAIRATQDRLGGVGWEHLIYAYMIENTRVYDIFRRVISELVHGEKLGLAKENTQRWLRSTEELWYRDPSPFFLPVVNSYIRSDLAATRRNKYHAMFGMDLNHGTESGTAYPFTKSETANLGFVSTFEEFLREVWVGMVNVANTSGAVPTDNAKIANLATKLHDMLMSRRVFGNMSREEFVFVSMMSWFDLTLSDQPLGGNLPIVTDLRAEAASPEERLFKIAQRVGLPAHGLSKSYFQIAQPISRILIVLETGQMNEVAAVPALYTPGSPVEADLRIVITDWSIISGREMKAGKVAPS
jgi:hypothetical protein